MNLKEWIRDWIYALKKAWNINIEEELMYKGQW